jgi:hypothetical protein
MSVHDCIVLHFVILLSSNEDSIPIQDSSFKEKTLKNKKDDPYKVFEHLQLSLEEVCGHSVSDAINIIGLLYKL